MHRTTWVGLFRLIRFELPFTAGVCALLGELLALGRIPSAAKATFGFLGIFCLSATALILNDYFDIETDRINAPHRPLPSGLVSRTETLVLSLIFAALGLVFSSLIGLQPLVVAVVLWVTGVAYNWKLKRTGLGGNLLVAFSVGMTFIFGGIVVKRPCEAVVWYLAFITFCVDLGEEIAADALDVDGDRRSGSRSLAVVMGGEKAMKAAAGVFGIVIVGSVIPFLFSWLAWPYLPVMVIWDVIVLYSVSHMVDSKRSDRLNDIRRIYRSGLAVFLIFIIIRLTVG